MGELKQLQEKLALFRDERDWKQFHKPKDLAISISLEAAELLEHFQWKTDGEAAKALEADREKFEDEMADILHYLLLLAQATNTDIVAASLRKISKNEKKYPVEKARGNAKKYNEL